MADLVLAGFQFVAKVLTVTDPVARVTLTLPFNPLLGRWP